MQRENLTAIRSLLATFRSFDLRTSIFRYDCGGLHMDAEAPQRPGHDLTTYTPYCTDALRAPYFFAIVPHCSIVIQDT